MSNVWASIACRPPCTAARAKPLLQLFSGYARSQRARYGGQCATSAIVRRQDESQAGAALTTRWRRQAFECLNKPERRSLSATALLASKPKKRPARPLKSNRTNDGPNRLPDSGVEPAQTVASHTEGLPSVEDGDGLTWRDYDPEGGMPLPDGELPQPEINAIFNGEEVSADTAGNYILSVMHWRRMSGALIDTGLDFPRRSGVTRDQALRGLQYVRTIAPQFDEQEAGQRWAEEESLRLQEEIQERSIKLGIYKRDPEDVVEEDESQQGTAYGRERSQESQLQRHREEREADWAREQAAKQAQQERDELATLHSHRGPLELSGGVQPTVSLTTTGPNGVTIGQAPTSAWLTPVERKPWVKYYEQQAQTIASNTLPAISTLGRLAPSLLAVLAILSLCLFASNNYTPPPKSARLWPDTKPAVATLTFLTATLTIAFVASRFPPVWRVLNKYFTIVPAYPYAFSLLGAAFRHDTLIHLTTNLVTLWLFGLSLHEDVGRGTFLAIFFASGALGGFASLAYNVLRKQWMSYIFGSSGAVLGVVAASCTLRPNTSIKVLGYEVPIAAWVFLALFGGAEVGAAWRGLRTTIDHAGHFGGIGAGVGAGLYLRLQAQQGLAGDGAMKRSVVSAAASAREGENR